MNHRRASRVLIPAFFLLLSVLPVLAAYTGPCPVGTSGAPYLIDPGIASGAKCRGACGQDCPPDRCELLKDSSGAMQPLVVTIQNPRGICTYNNVLECPIHTGCIEHDACFDDCAAHGQNSMTDYCHTLCNYACFKQYGVSNCVRWADAPTLILQNEASANAGWAVDQLSGVEFTGYYFFSDPPVFTEKTLTPTKTPTPTPTITRAPTLATSPPVTSLMPEPSAAPSVAGTGSTGSSGPAENDLSMAAQRQRCAAAGGSWDFFSEGCVIPEPGATPTLGIPDLFKDKPTIQFTPDDFKKAADDAEKNGNHQLAVTYINAAENIYLKKSPDKDSRPPDIDRDLAALETEKAGVYLNMGKPDAANEAQNNAKGLIKDATTKESDLSFLPGFGASAGVLALGLIFLFRRRKE